jgi:hypothetical protein
MKPEETQRHPQAIAMKHALRKMPYVDANVSEPVAMNAGSMRVRLVQTGLAVWLGLAGVAHAAGAAVQTVERAPDASLTRDRSAGPDASKEASDDCKPSKPYGSGYEARHIGADRDSAAPAACPASGASAGARASGSTAAPRMPAAGHAAGGNRNSPGRHGRR